MSELATTPGSVKGLRPQDLDPIALTRQQRRLAAAAAQPWLHVEVARRMADRLEFIKLQPRRVLDVTPALGAGHELLRAAYPHAQLLWHEDVAWLASRAQQALAPRGWRRLRGAAEARVLSLPAQPPVDLLWSNMALHGCVDLPGQLARWQASLATDGFVMFSCLGPDSFVELRPLYAQAGWGRPAPDWWDMHDLGDLLVHAGFADPVMDQERLRLTWAEPEKLLADLRALGGNLAPTRFAGLRGRVWRRQLLQGLDALRDADGRIVLTLELVFGHALKAAPKLTVAAETRVSVDSMRSALRSGRKPG